MAFKPFPPKNDKKPVPPVPGKKKGNPKALAAALRNRKPKDPVEAFNDGDE